MTASKNPAAEIRRELREKLGLTSRQVSVRKSSSGYDTAIDITVKVPGIRVAAVEAVAGRQEVIRRDHRTGDVLRGGNTVVMCSLDWQLPRPRKAVAAWLETLPVGHECYPVPGSENVMGGITVCHESTWEYAVRHHEGEHGQILGTAGVTTAGDMIAEAFVEAGQDFPRPEVVS